MAKLYQCENKIKSVLFSPTDEGSSKLQNILVFATGANEIPPIGFIPAPSIEFLHEGSEESSSKRMLPMANTCINCLKLPLLTSYEVFKENMDFALGNTQGFGRTWEVSAWVKYISKSAVSFK